MIYLKESKAPITNAFNILKPLIFLFISTTAELNKFYLNSNRLHVDFVEALQ